MIFTDKSAKLYEGIIFILFLVYFSNSIVWIFQNYFGHESYDFKLLFFLIIIFSIYFIINNREKLQNYLTQKFYLAPVIGLLAVLLLNTINVFFFHFNVISAMLLFLGIYCLSGFYLKKHIWNRGFFLICIIISTLPIIYHVQTFLGFPIRVFSAKIVSGILKILGFNSFSQASIIITENNASSIDLPCSGVKSIYMGAIFMLFVYFLKNIRISLKMFSISALFFLSLIFFNIWRIFILVYIYDILDMKNIADTSSRIKTTTLD